MKVIPVVLVFPWPPDALSQPGGYMSARNGPTEKVATAKTHSDVPIVLARLDAAVFFVEPALVKVIILLLRLSVLGRLILIV